MPPFISSIEPVARITVAALFNSVWEAAILVFAVWAILRLVPNVNASTRYAAWCVALAGSLLLPVLTAVPHISVEQAHVWTASHRVAVTRTSAAIVPAKAAAAPHSMQSGPAAARSAFRVPSRLRFSLPEYVALALFAAWALAALLLLARLALNLWRLERLKRDALPLPIEYRERLAQWTAADKGAREARLCICDDTDVPVAVGIFDSMILIPRHLLDSLSPGEIDQIMLHELGHLRRADDWTNGVQRLIQALLFFNPAILYVAQQLDLEREVACDDWVLHQTKNVRPYATCLTKMAEVTAWPHRPLAAPGVFVTRRGLSIRVERLLRAGRNVHTTVSMGPAGAVVAALVVMFFVLQSVAPSFAFTLPQMNSANPPAKIVAKTPIARHTLIVRKTEVAVAPATAAPAPKPSATDLYIPGNHIHIPARTIHIPAVNVDIPSRHVHIVRPSMPPMPPMPPGSLFPADFGAQISRQVNDAMKQAFNAGPRGGNFNCMGCDYSGKNVSGRSFRGQRIIGSDFSRANAQNADFSNTVLIRSDFSGADLRHASFANARLTECDLSNADIAQADFTGVKMVACDVSGVKAVPSQATALLRGCSSGCDFSGFDLHGADIHFRVTGVDLERSDLTGANLSGSTFTGVDFRQSRFDGAHVTGTTFINCRFDGVDTSLLTQGGAHIVNGTGFQTTP
ncbi:MAG: M56 family metallopeptidase [Candidatus Baltobacteraceae bacterium]